ncbi:MAG TPA: hypothetical protein VGG39_11880 [Polyangiaceae bacterium]|jgi:hypothetical protein
MARILSRIAAGVVVGLLATSSARASRPHPVRFLGADPVGPLASVERAVIRTPEARSCRAWGPVGSRWEELDPLGQIAGEVVVTGRDFYAYSGCDELGVRRVNGHRGAGVYVEAQAGYRAPDSRRWRPDDASIATLVTLASARQRGITHLDPSHGVPFSRRTFFFEWGPAPERFAVVGGVSLLVCAWQGGRWTVVHEVTPPKGRAVERGYRALAVTDMNGDGLPEIVFHRLEESGEWYGDATLSRRPDGAWVEIDAGIFGSTA